MNRSIAAVLLSSGVVCPALGQMVTPPPPVVPKVDAYIPKAPPLPPAIPQPVAAPPIPPRAKVAQVVVPDLKWESLVKRDDKGVLEQLDEPIDLAALRKNPMVKPETMELVKPVLAERRATFERAVIDNLDIIEKVDAGLIDRADYGSKDGITRIVNELKPLVPKAVPEPLTNELLDRKILSPEEAAFSRTKIIKEYQDASYPPNEHDPTKKTERSRQIVRIIQRQSINEPMLTYRDLAAEAAPKLAEIAGSVGVSGVSAKGLKPGMSANEKAAIFKSATAGLTIDQRRAILRKVIETRTAK